MWDERQGEIKRNGEKKSVANEGEKDGERRMQGIWLKGKGKDEGVWMKVNKWKYMKRKGWWKRLRGLGSPRIVLTPVTQIPVRWGHKPSFCCCFGTELNSSLLWFNRLSVSNWSPTESGDGGPGSCPFSFWLPAWPSWFYFFFFLLFVCVRACMWGVIAVMLSRNW